VKRPYAPTERPDPSVHYFDLTSFDATGLTQIFTLGILSDAPEQPVRDRWGFVRL
jgi:hypothetical protein